MVAPPSSSSCDLRCRLPPVDGDVTVSQPARPVIQPDQSSRPVSQSVKQQQQAASPGAPRRRIQGRDRRTLNDWTCVWNMNQRSGRLLNTNLWTRRDWREGKRRKGRKKVSELFGFLGGVLGVQATRSERSYRMEMTCNCNCNCFVLPGILH